MVQFYSVASFVEQVDEDLLDRLDLDTEGALYKIFNTLADSSTTPPFVPGVHGGTSGGVEKKTREWENNSDIQALIDGISASNPNRHQYMVDNLNIPEIISYMAASIIIQDWDMFPKNHYMYRDTEGSGEWSIIPWDRDNSWGYPRWMNDGITASHPTLSHPLYGDSEHPNVYGSTHPLNDAILDDPVFREMYLRRLRTVLDEILQDPSTPVVELKLEQRIDELLLLMEDEVNADKAIYGNPYGTQQDLAIALAIIKNDYLAPRRVHLYNTHGPAGSGLIPSAQVGGETTQFTTLIDVDATVKAHVPATGILSTSWTGGSEPFDDSLWSNGTSGVGYEDTPADYAGLINIDVGTEMQTNDSVYVRVPFAFDTQQNYDRLLLNMKFDDGFVAYLNGIQVASFNDPTNGSLSWNSPATDNYADANNNSFTAFDITQHLNLLIDGTNILAIHGLNDQTGGAVGSSSDMLILPQLLAGVTTAGSNDQPTINFGQVDFNPISNNQDEEFIELTNPNSIAVDISGWQLTGGVQHTFAPGTVIPAGGSLYVSPNVTAFRSRATGPSGGQGLFVQGNYSGHISNLGETIDLVASDSTIVSAIDTPFVPSETQEFLRVTEVHYNPTTSGDATEFIELQNISDTVTLDLTGVQIVDGPSTPFAFSGSNVTSLLPGGFVLVVKDQTAFQSTYPSVNSNIIAGEFSGSLSNGGETIKVEDATNSTIVEFKYEDGKDVDEEDWHPETDGEGFTLVPIETEGNYDLGTNWRSSALLGGSPGADDSQSLSADFNGDGNVDAVDMAILLENYGTSATAHRFIGDANNNRQVSLKDLLILKQQFGDTIISAPAAAAASLKVSIDAAPKANSSKSVLITDRVVTIEFGETQIQEQEDSLPTRRASSQRIAKTVDQVHETILSTPSDRANSFHRARRGHRKRVELLTD